MQEISTHEGWTEERVGRALREVRTALVAYLRSLNFPKPETMIDHVKVGGSIARRLNNRDSDLDIEVGINRAHWNMIGGAMNLEVGQLRDYLIRQVNQHLHSTPLVPSRDFRLKALEDKGRLVDVHIKII